MNWCLVLTPEKVCAAKNQKELYVVKLEDWNPDTITEAIKQVDHYLASYREGGASSAGR